jgi:hypothetical protein
VRDVFDSGTAASCVLRTLVGQRSEAETAGTSACSGIAKLGDGECDVCNGDDERRATCGCDAE